MGRLDLADKHVDWVSVTREFLDELYAQIAQLKDDKARLLAEMGEMRMGRRTPPVFRDRRAA